MVIDRLLGQRHLAHRRRHGHLRGRHGRLLLIWPGDQRGQNDVRDVSERRDPLAGGYRSGSL